MPHSTTLPAWTPDSPVTVLMVYRLGGVCGTVGPPAFEAREVHEFGGSRFADFSRFWWQARQGV